MKKVISVFLALSLMMSILVIPTSASNSVSALSLDFCGQRETVTIAGIKSEFYSYTSDNGQRIVEVTENGVTDILAFDDVTGHVYVNGRRITNTIPASMPALVAADNWGPERVETRQLNVEGLAVSVVAAIIVGCFTSWNGDAMQLAQTVVEAGISWLYYLSITQFNYEDYFPKVGYRLTEELHSGPECDKTTLLCRRTMTGSR